MSTNQIIAWLLEGDVSIQYQTWRDLLDTEKPGLRKRIEKEGWGKEFLSRRHPDGHWGLRFYQPKWISTHYTLLDLKNLQISPDQKAIKETLVKVFEKEKAPDGGIGPFGMDKRSDVCINGMVLNYGSYFHVPEKDLIPVIDFLLNEKMPDGGFNCNSNGKGAVHSSLHTTLSVLEGILEYRNNGYTYRLDELLNAKKESEEFILKHRLFRSDKTGAIIHPNLTRLYYPSRWYYDILRALDYFQFAGVDYDPRMKDALDLIISNRTENGVWKLPSKHPGQTHFEMEQAGKPSQWNTLRAMRVLKRYGESKTGRWGDGEMGRWGDLDNKN
ncbi:MAG: prenyltransferase/squalene oxidase repeat-containing protein [Bacteroidia bacterium]